MDDVDKKAAHKPPLHLISPGKLMFFWRLPNNSLAPCLKKPKVIAAQNRSGVGGVPDCPLLPRVVSLFSTVQSFSIEFCKIAHPA
jgi:hypothetical protein